MIKGIVQPCPKDFCNNPQGTTWPCKSAEGIRAPKPPECVDGGVWPCVLPGTNTIPPMVNCTGPNECGCVDNGKLRLCPAEKCEIDPSKPSPCPCYEPKAPLSNIRSVRFADQEEIEKPCNFFYTNPPCIDNKGSLITENEAYSRQMSTITWVVLIILILLAIIIAIIVIIISLSKKKV